MSACVQEGLWSFTAVLAQSLVTICRHAVTSSPSPSGPRLLGRRQFAPAGDHRSRARHPVGRHRDCLSTSATHSLKEVIRRKSTVIDRMKVTVLGITAVLLAGAVSAASAGDGAGIFAANCAQCLPRDHRARRHASRQGVEGARACRQREGRGRRAGRRRDAHQAEPEARGGARQAERRRHHRGSRVCEADGRREVGREHDASEPCDEARSAPGGWVVGRGPNARIVRTIRCRPSTRP
jgi:hypothetical protein